MTERLSPVFGSAYRTETKIRTKRNIIRYLKLLYFTDLLAGGFIPDLISNTLHRMKITVIAGSHRKESQSERVARFVEGELKVLKVDTDLFSLSKNPLPLFDEGLWEGKEPWKSTWLPISERLQSSDGFVVVSPEWGGMVPAGLKNLFLISGNKEFGHKPALIVAVSSGVSGSYPIAELRMSSYKNTHLCYIPDHVIVRNCEKMLLGDTPADHHDQSTRERIGYSLKMLIEYSKALQGVRESGVIDFKKFPFGM